MHFFTFFLYLLSIGWCIELHADEAKLCQEQLIEQIIQPKTRQNAIVELRTKYQLKSQKLKAKFQRELHSEAINYDIVIIGGGPATISFIAGVRAANPLLKILVIDESDTLAPAFEGPGKALIFNSMTIYDEIEPINAHHFPNHFLQLLANIFSIQFDHRGILIGNAELKHIYSTIFDYQITLQKRVQGFELIYQNLQKANHLTLSEADLQHLISLTTLYARFWLHEAFIDHVSMSKNSLIEKYMKVWSYQLSIFATEEGKASLGEYWENVHE